MQSFRFDTSGAVSGLPLDCSDVDLEGGFGEYTVGICREMTGEVW